MRYCKLLIVQQTIETHILIVNRWAASFGVDATRRRALFTTENISHLELGENDFLSSEKIKISTRLKDYRNIATHFLFYLLIVIQIFYDILWYLHCRGVERSGYKNFRRNTIEPNDRVWKNKL